MPTMLTSWGRAIFTEGRASIITAQKDRQAASEEGKVWPISHHSPILGLAYLNHRAVWPQQCHRSHSATGPTALHQTSAFKRCHDVQWCTTVSMLLLHVFQHAHVHAFPQNPDWMVFEGRGGNKKLMMTPGLSALAHCTWMTSPRHTDKITHQLSNTGGIDSLMLQIDG